MTTVNFSIRSPLENVFDFYSKSAKIYKDCPMAVGWSSEEEQTKRFEVISNFITPDDSVLDLGCGYGAFYKFLVDKKKKPLFYFGYDICKRFIRLARQRYYNTYCVEFKCSKSITVMGSFAVASGTFNIKYNSSVEEWEKIVYSSIDSMARTSRNRFAFNMIKGSCEDSDLFYRSEINQWMEYCSKFGNVKIIEGYAENDFTVVVRRRKQI